MSSAHYQSFPSRYQQQQHPTLAHGSGSGGDTLRLPPIRELALSSQGGPPPPPRGEHPSVSSHHLGRHAPPSWGRSKSSHPPPAPMTPQHQHSQPASVQELPPPSKSTEYPTKQSSGGFFTPGMPLSAQMAPGPGSITSGPGSRGNEPSHLQPPPKRLRAEPTANGPREGRPSHSTYQHPQYAPFPSPQNPSASPYPAQQPGPLPPPPSEPVHQHQHQQSAPVGQPSHPGYASYQHHQPPPSQYPPARQPPSVHQGPPPPPPPPLQQHPPPPVQHQSRGTPYPPQHTPVPPHHTPVPPHHTPVPPHHTPIPPQQAPPEWEHHRHPQQPQPPPPPPHHNHPQQYSQPPPQHQHHHPHHPQQPPPLAPPPPPLQVSYPTNPPPVTSPAETRQPSITSNDQEYVSKREGTLHEIVKCSTHLYHFANRYANVQTNLQNAQPPPHEMAEMSNNAQHVVRLLEDLRRLSLSEEDRANEAARPSSPVEPTRAPKRPWDEISQDGPDSAGPSFSEYRASSVKDQTTAEQDMEIIRTKRATSTASGTATAGQPKTKYRKRSRATPPGKCHSCNIRETPEWRRGPDGARTLCNACGLHYAKLMRKRDKTYGPDDGPRIDLETLRASARAADIGGPDKSTRRQSQSGATRSSKDKGSPSENLKPLPGSHHQGSFQLMPVNPGPSGTPLQSVGGHMSMMQTHDEPSAPTPPWSASNGSGPPPPTSARAYPPEHMQPQPYSRSG